MKAKRIQEISPGRLSAWNKNVKTHGKLTNVLLFCNTCLKLVVGQFGFFRCCGFAIHNSRLCGLQIRTNINKAPLNFKLTHYPDIVIV